MATSYITIWNGRRDRPDRGLLSPPCNEDSTVIQSREAPKRDPGGRAVALPRGPGNLNGQVLRVGPATARRHSQLHDIQQEVERQGQMTHEQLMTWLMNVHYMDRPAARAAVYYAVKKARYLEPINGTTEADACSEDAEEQDHR